MKSIQVMGAAVVLSVSLVSGLASGLAMAHGNASGVVKERMELMEEMKESMKSMSDIFSGKADYNAQAIREAARVIRENSGTAMTRLFPEGSVHGPSEAKPEIWQEWDRFESQAAQLQRYSEALEKAADNGRASAAGSSSNMMGSGSMMGSSMMGSDSMMGSSGMMGNMMGSAGPDEEHLSEMPADMVFRMLTDTCSSCHTRYRIEE
ncbi:c-type cytochrome [Marinobacterium mangrovicola]|uniref:Cytochrome c556 n=1 Tax=Marinobacterium mangrovicola TaxID=1476959 RepID=A0A4R1G701_9GAMM|nr:cytochrome c [Marinobacterium mangrovicola]TCK02353.1 cytochrome c556 [Marinobacterium mangrovicola]